MSWLVRPRLVNEPFSDPGLFIDFRFGRRALLFDLGDLSPLSWRELMRVSDAFVSHMHMDHFAGFDRLLRACLYRPAPLHLAGPAGFLDAVAAKLSAYTWNLLGEASVDFSIVASEWGEAGYGRCAVFRAREAFRRKEAEPPALPPGILLDEGEFRVEGAVLDHGTPCLAFALQERLRVDVRPQGLAELGLTVGPWLTAAKRAVRLGAPDDTPVPVSPRLGLPLGVLKQHALRAARGQRIAYVVDAAFHADNVARMVALARGADQLFIEAPFLDEDEAIAAARAHLTAGQAGRIARQAGVKRLTPFHFSPRYLSRADLLRRQADAAFAAGRENATA
ncbi:MBL fold metallo-hydrolase [Chelatococcus sp. SYSU_G07232]|uniref:MBL fold metallo-hydrolase n=1 Tax=Chelatococcus albus TaxID=3047466 RepID=A0ABT7AJI2_9HYPH|nr:MBL fold metallo-hydrolase [Chelatococcus sp. SYSU_G07232]MDJ1159540.1 MBL fold metallo-hydrolase [Chelatococcus sp. SYSU_G07232]